MKAIPQYTIRNMPESADRYLRRRAQESGKSINQVVIDIVSKEAGVTKDDRPQTLLDSLSWFIGTGMDQDVLDALEEDDKTQKLLARRELEGSQKLHLHDN